MIDFFTQPATVQVTCERGLADYLADELTALGFPPRRIHRTGVEIAATGGDCEKICLQSRIAYAVLYELLAFAAENPEQLYRAAAAYPWEQVLRGDVEITLDCRVQTASVNDTRYPALKLKDAIVDRLRNVYGARPNSNREHRGAVIQLNWQESRAWIFLNAAGNKLSDRGYRKIPLVAPLRETLAAAILRAMAYDGTQALVNPMCGSGTLAIEAALIARNAAAGLLRDDFAFKHYKNFDAEFYQNLRRELAKQKRRTTAPIIAGDLDPLAVEAAKKNAATAGVDQQITFYVGAFADTPLPDLPAAPASPDARAPTLIILNPPYNERLGGDAALYKNIGDWLKQKCAGATGFVFTGNRELAKKIGLKPDRRLEFFNATIDCRLLKFSLY